jgi:L-iditol 2-dehydrogenase
MKAAVYYNNNDIRLEEVADPIIGPGELLVKIMASGICGSDVMEWYRIHKAPLILGHEISGEVVEVGEGVCDFKIGDRVVTTHHVPCNTCKNCLSGHHTVCDTLLSKTHFDPGGFCEYVRLPEVNVKRGTWKIADDLSYDLATFVEPLACVLRGQQIARFSQGQSVLVLGSGISGILHINLAASTGAGMIVATDINEYRLKTAEKFGATHTLDAKKDVAREFKSLNNGQGAELVIICASAEAVFSQAMSAVARGGTILIFAPTMDGVTIPLSVNELFWRKDVTMTTTYAGSPGDCATALELISNRRLSLEEMITHRFPLADAVKGFQLVAGGESSLKVIVQPFAC